MKAKVSKAKESKSLFYIFKKGKWMDFIKSVEKLEITTSKSSPLKRSSHFTLPEKLRNIKRLVNMNNKKDNECFKWAITRALNPLDHNKGNILKILREQSKELNWDGIEFPTPNSKKFYKKFEKNNTIRLNVFGHDNNKIINSIRCFTRTL